MIEKDVIANQPAGWCGNPLKHEEMYGDCHASVCTGLQ